MDTSLVHVSVYYTNITCLYSPWPAVVAPVGLINEGETVPLFLVLGHTFRGVTEPEAVLSANYQGMQGTCTE